jgi:hypothetical protein
LNSEKFGPIHTLVMMFESTLQSGSVARMPEKPALDQFCSALGARIVLFSLC